MATRRTVAAAAAAATAPPTNDSPQEGRPPPRRQLRRTVSANSAPPQVSGRESRGYRHQEVDEFYDVQQEFDQTKGLYSHHAPVEEGVGSIPIPGSSRSSSSYNYLRENEDLVHRIGGLVGPRYDGTMGNGGFEGDLIEVDRAVGGKANPVVRNLRELLTNWFDDLKREDLILRIQEAVGGVAGRASAAAASGRGATGGLASRNEALRVLYQNLRNIADKKSAHYGPSWLEDSIKRLWMLEKHPYFVASKLLQVLTGYPATNHITQQAKMHYLPQIQAGLSEMSDQIKEAEVRRDILKGLYDAEVERDNVFMRMRDILLLNSFPPSGLDVTELLKILPDYLKRVNIKEMPYGLDGSTERKTYQGLVDLVNSRRSFNPAVGVVTALTGTSHPPWEQPAVKPIEIGKIDKAAELGTFGTWYDTQLKSLGIKLSEYLKGQLNQAFQAFTIGIVNTQAKGDNAPGIGGGSNSRKIGLALTGELWRFVHDEMKENVTTAGNRFMLRMYELPDKPRVDIGAIKSALLDESVSNFAVSLAPYTPGSVIELPGGVRIVHFSKDKLSKNKAATEYLGEFYQRLDSMILNPNNGVWNNLVLNVNWNPDIDKGKVSGINPDHFSIQSYFEELTPDLSKFNGESKNRNEFIRFIELLRSGTRMSDVITKLDSLMAQKSQVGTALSKARDEMDQLKKVQDTLLKCLSTTPHTANVAGVLSSFPIQYHIDARFTLLYVLVQYERIRGALSIITDLCRETLTEAIAQSRKEWKAAKDKLADLELKRVEKEVGLSELTWRIQPEQTGLISLDPLVSASISLAWAWIMRFATHVPWRDKTVMKRFTADEVIRNMSEDDPDAFIFKSFLIEVVALMMSEKNIVNTTTVANPSSAQQIAAGSLNQATLKVRCVQLRLVVRSDNGIGPMTILGPEQVQDDWWKQQQDKWSLVFLPRTIADWR